MLRELLFRDFGKDLKISGGAGNFVDDPIIIEVESAHDASWTEMEVASCIYGHLGWHWRAVGRTKLEEGGKHIEKLSCEVKYIEGTPMQSSNLLDQFKRLAKHSRLLCRRGAFAPASPATL